MIDWQSSESIVLLNPRFPTDEGSSITQQLLAISSGKSYIWLASSGTTGPTKWIALTKKAFLHSATTVNTFIGLSPSDRWLQVLPSFHVGGLGIWARSYLSGTRVIDLYTATQGKWNVHTFYQTLIDYQISWSALVPAQVYDLVQRHLQAPSSLIGIIVGGGALSLPVYQAATQLGWKLWLSYGLTECASQVATASIISRPSLTPSPLQILPHVQLALSTEGYLKIKSPSLLDLYAVSSPIGFNFYDPKVEGWLTTSDLAEIEGHSLKIVGRQQHLLKIGGENVNVQQLEAKWQHISLQFEISADREMFDTALFAREDERLGYTMQLAITKKTDETLVKQLMTAYNQMVLPFERIRQVHRIPSIPRSALGKLLYPELLKQLN